MNFFNLLLRQNLCLVFFNITLLLVDFIWNHCIERRVAVDLLLDTLSSKICRPVFTQFFFMHPQWTLGIDFSRESPLKVLIHVFFQVTSDCRLANKLFDVTILLLFRFTKSLDG